ncbi:hypothetical protein Tco_0680221 [Tanacetum coccineum]|uniref:Uncharacterized protein n=1 Tax=Tanacetum coccineum TaxID=301880 RepID=A0ABQ4XK11_9ASTR
MPAGKHTVASGNKLSLLSNSPPIKPLVRIYQEISRKQFKMGKAQNTRNQKSTIKKPKDSKAEAKMSAL